MSTVPTAPTTHLGEDADRRRRLGAGLFASVAAYAVAVVMMGLVFASTPPPRLLEGIADFEEGRALYQWGFVGASMLAPAFVSMLLLLAAGSGVPASSTRRTVATVLLGAYVAAASFAYTSQYTFFPDLSTGIPKEQRSGTSTMTSPSPMPSTSSATPCSGSPRCCWPAFWPSAIGVGSPVGWRGWVPSRSLRSCCTPPERVRSEASSASRARR
jgi:hypothetical protein